MSSMNVVKQLELDEYLERFELALQKHPSNSAPVQSLLDKVVSLINAASHLTADNYYRGAAICQKGKNHQAFAQTCLEKADSLLPSDRERDDARSRYNLPKLEPKSAQKKLDEEQSKIKKINECGSCGKIGGLHKPGCISLKRK